MRSLSAEHEFSYPWEEVTLNNWRKYCPWNDKATHVVGVDTISRTLDPSTGIMRTERLITCRQAAPKWLQPFLAGRDSSLVYEVSYVDPKAKRLTMCSQNLTLADLIKVCETVHYTPSGAEKTRFEQSAKAIALCGGFNKVKSKIEEFTVTRFKENAVKGREGFEKVLAMSRKAFAEQREREKEGMTA